MERRWPLGGTNLRSADPVGHCRRCGGGVVRAGVGDPLGGRIACVSLCRHWCRDRMCGRADLVQQRRVLRAMPAAHRTQNDRPSGLLSLVRPSVLVPGSGRGRRVPQAVGIGCCARAVGGWSCSHLDSKRLANRPRQPGELVGSPPPTGKQGACLSFPSFLSAILGTVEGGWVRTKRPQESSRKNVWRNADDSREDCMRRVNLRVTGLCAIEGTCGGCSVTDRRKRRKRILVDPVHSVLVRERGRGANVSEGRGMDFVSAVSRLLDLD